MIVNQAGNTSYGPAAELQQGVAATQATTSMSVLSSSDPSTYGQAVSFTATITGGNPTGSVQFVVDGSNFGSAVPVSAGSATLGSITTLSPGTHTVTASYPGDTNDTSSSGTLSGGQVVNTADAGVTVTTSGSPSAYGQQVVFTATINGANGLLKHRNVKVKPEDVTGSVSWSDANGSMTCAEGNPSTVTSVNSGTSTATCTTTALAPNPSDTITANYSGDSNHNSGSGTVSQVIDQLTTTTSVVAAPPTSTFGQSVTFTATIGAENNFVKGNRNVRKPKDVTGNVTWSANTGCSDSTVSGVPPQTATCTTTSLPGGDNTVTATYAGDANHSGSSGSASETVGPVSQTITFSTNPPANAVYGTSFTVAASASSGLPVAFTSAGGCSNSGAMYTMTSGTTACSVIANQAGDADYAAAPQVTKSVTAAKANQSITVSQPAPASAPLAETFTIGATASSGLAVSFGASGACTVSSGTYRITATTGTCHETMNQAGDTNYNAATTVTESTTVAAAVAPSVSFTGAPTTEAYNNSFTVTASSNETGNQTSTPVIKSSTAAICSLSNVMTSGTTVTATVTMLTGTGTCTLNATWAANNAYKAASATQKTTATALTPTVSFTGAPASEAKGSTFTVTASSNESGPYAKVPTIAASPSNVCSVGAVSSNGSDGYQATVTMKAATGTCTSTAKWAASSGYVAASATQTTTATSSAVDGATQQQN